MIQENIIVVAYYLIVPIIFSQNIKIIFKIIF